MQADLNALTRWCGKNGIFINTQKTKYMVFGSKLRLAKPDINTIRLKANRQTINRVHSYCYLGITLDEQINYEQHAQGTLSRVRNKLSQLKTMKYFLTKQAALMVYKNMILPILEYGDILLSSLSSCTRKRMQIMQNKALRMIFDKDRRESKKTLHKEASLDELKVRRKLHTLQFIFRKKSDKKLLVRSSLGRKTRSSKKLMFKLRKPNTEKYKNYHMQVSECGTSYLLPFNSLMTQMYLNIKLRLFLPRKCKHKPTPKT